MRVSDASLVRIESNRRVRGADLRLCSWSESEEGDEKPELDADDEKGDGVEEVEGILRLRRV